MGIQIRLARAEDLSRLRGLTAESFGNVSIDHGIETLYGEINGRDWRWRKVRHVDDDFARDPDGLFVATDDINGELVGYVSTWRDPAAGMGHIPNLVVSESRRREGIGRQLLHRALEHFRASGLSHARIETLVQNDAGRTLYESLGFREVARQIHFACEL